ncbi:MAG: phytanoyl-CoA dioxygenase family protein [Pseudomonadota bacterium]
MLTDPQKASYAENGYLVIESVLSKDAVAQCVEEIERFRSEAAGLAASNDRIDLEDSHTPDNPRIRRIKDPFENSPVFREIIRSEAILEPVRDLLGPDLRLHGSKLNMKSAAYGAPVEWHQDWAFYPHTNDSMLAVGVMLNDMQPENGPLLVLPGTQAGPVFDHTADGYFCGAMDLDACGLADIQPARLTGPAGSISLHHVRVVHGSDLNRSSVDRKLLLFEISAADAFPIYGSTSSFESIEAYDARMLCGEPTAVPRLEPVPVRLPVPRRQAGSIYEFQSATQNRSFSVYGAEANAVQ